MKHAVCYLTTCPNCVPARKVPALSAKAPEEEPITANPLISKYGTPSASFFWYALYQTQYIGFICGFRVLEKHTLAKGVTLDFKQIRRGINSRSISRHGVEFIKDMIVKSGQPFINKVPFLPLPL